MTATTCPPWCGRESEHDLHTRHAGRAGDVSVSLVLDDAWDRPRLLVSTTAPGRTSRLSCCP